ncbi:hypothetical protein A3D78_04810 [Candidatus Gottesmanbacteria bacterium RIFCSPHIGHO2_02_FULL_39_14]|uniref:Uncharacterized protein n=3 Tax=Candidatus Gottesmaniibacteriota TaxID=1752720 RepID=A0A1F5ZTU1_9BACT|nr:MAG: hypothetical protein A2153_03415 [Candidatus Gottesmanbacteria bacterium RBG_16_38_7b]OGG15793.1 MAG: hypothetical protein A3D78_04810 [Candidatus Gottesmanbacteria bacterium RIFCSPHIGHO2_02_FULL_39_14]OGG32461.1 MAG: hypothetical protein A3I51_05530 [Candidatus Gottesmanbacteria bacterium RIFCSPLOWO2_02_FULL_38_8]
MNIYLILLIILIISLLLAISESRRELSVPKQIAKIKIKKQKKLSGVILFLKEKIIHYSSDSS